MAQRTEPTRKRPWCSETNTTQQIPPDWGILLIWLPAETFPHFDSEMVSACLLSVVVFRHLSRPFTTQFRSPVFRFQCLPHFLTSSLWHLFDWLESIYSFRIPLTVQSVEYRRSCVTRSAHRSADLISRSLSSVPNIASKNNQRISANRDSYLSSKFITSF